MISHKHLNYLFDQKLLTIVIALFLKEDWLVDDRVKEEE